MFSHQNQKSFKTLFLYTKIHHLSRGVKIVQIMLTLLHTLPQRLQSIWKNCAETGAQGVKLLCVRTFVILCSRAKKGPRDLKRGPKERA